MSDEAPRRRVRRWAARQAPPPGPLKDLESEEGIKREVVRVLDRLAVVHWPVGSSKFGISGVGDRMCVVYGLHIEIECKGLQGAARRRNTLSAQQDLHRRRVTGAEGVYLVVDDRNIHQFEELFRRAILERLAWFTGHTDEIYRRVAGFGPLGGGGDGGE